MTQYLSHNNPTLDMGHASPDLLFILYPWSVLHACIYAFHHGVPTSSGFWLDLINDESQPKDREKEGSEAQVFNPFLKICFGLAMSIN